VWYWLTDGADSAARSKVEAKLMRPLPGAEPTPEVVNYELAMFQKSLAKNAGSG
jgi:hypothetical protein